MATITITVGAVSATRTYADNQKAGQVLGLFADAVGVDPELPAQERLEGTIDELVGIIVHRARNQHVESVAAVAVGEAGSIGMS